MAWVKLKEYCDWSTNYYAFPGQGLTERGMASADLGLKRPKLVEVKWPDGFVGNYKVHEKVVCEEMYDHGHVSSAYHKRWFIKEKLNGFKVEVDMLDVKVNTKCFKK